MFLFSSSTVWKIKYVFFRRDCPKLLLFPMSHVIPDSMIQKSNRHIWIFDTERLDCSYEQLLCLFNEIILLFLPNIPNRQPLFPCIAQRVRCAMHGNNNQCSMPIRLQDDGRGIKRRFGRTRRCSRQFYRLLLLFW